MMEHGSKLPELFNLVKSKLDTKIRVKKYIKEYPTTPDFVVEAITKLVVEQETKENIDPDQLIIDSGMYLRKIVVNYAWKGNSAGGCWDFSLKLRDTYNFIFEELNLGSRASLVYGNFGPKNTDSNHHWVAVLSNNIQDIKLPEIEKGIFVDGTVDQYKNWSVLTEDQKTYFGNNLLLVSHPNDQTIKRNFYRAEGVSPAPSAWFVRK